MRCSSCCVHPYHRSGSFRLLCSCFGPLKFLFYLLVVLSLHDLWLLQHAVHRVDWHRLLRLTLSEGLRKLLNLRLHVWRAVTVLRLHWAIQGIYCITAVGCCAVVLYGVHVLIRDLGVTAGGSGDSGRRLWPLLHCLTVYLLSRRRLCLMVVTFCKKARHKDKESTEDYTQYTNYCYYQCSGWLEYFLLVMIRFC